LIWLQSVFIHVNYPECLQAAKTSSERSPSVIRFLLEASADFEQRSGTAEEVLYNQSPV
jgi:hypothetical protein